MEDGAYRRKCNVVLRENVKVRSASEKEQCISETDGRLDTSTAGPPGLTVSAFDICANEVEQLVEYAAGTRNMRAKWNSLR